MTTEWNLHYDAWIIEDGSPHRAVGEIFDWGAIAFWTQEALAKVDARSRSAAPILADKYRVVAEVVHLSEKACVIDFGLRAIAGSDLLATGCIEGDYVAGEVWLNLPLCFEIAPESVVLSLRYRWKVERISADLTPFVAHPDNPRFFTRDDSRVRYEDVTATSSIKAHSYILCCSEMPLL